MVALLALEAQGSLLAVANHTVTGSSNRAGGGSRGLVYGFSRASRTRMIRKMSRLQPEKVSFVTLTYPARFPRPDEAKNHLRALFERFRRRFKQSSGIWRMEYQDRGAPHFHVIFFNLPFVPFEELRRWWTEIISDYVDEHRPHVRIEQIRSKRGALHYVAKYAAKMSAAETLGSPFFNLDAYLHAGRVWGCFNSPALPYAPQVYIEFLTSDPRALPEIKKVMRRYYPSITKARFRGGVLLHDKCYDLHADLIRLMSLYGADLG